MSVVLNGYARAFPLSPGATAQLPPGGLGAVIPPDGVVVEASEAGIDADFTRFGAAYSISLQCEDPDGDPRCKDEAYVRRLIGRMTLVMPRRGG
jgi:hypothetical protein